MNCNLTERFLKAFSSKPQSDEIIELVDNRLKLVKSEHEDDFFRIYFDNYDYFPTPKRINTILKDHKNLRIQTTFNYGNPNKNMAWRDIKNLFPINFENGQICLICGEPLTKTNCHVVEKEDGYDKTQICPCCGSDPELQYIEEWKAYCRTNGLCSYQMFYLHKINREKQ